LHETLCLVFVWAVGDKTKGEDADGSLIKSVVQSVLDEIVITILIILDAGTECLINSEFKNFGAAGCMANITPGTIVFFNIRGVISKVYKVLLQ
jgi:hypothetical protein